MYVSAHNSRLLEFDNAVIPEKHWTPWSWTPPRRYLLPSKVGPLLRGGNMWKSIPMDQTLHKPFDTLRKEKADPYLNYVFILVRVNTGPFKQGAVMILWGF